MTNLVIAITGPTGSGKTTVSKLLSKRIDNCVNIDVDHVKHMIECGFQKIEHSSVHLEWKYKEWKLVGESIGLLAANFQEHGFNVIINGFIGNDGWDSLNNIIDITHKYLLLPDLEAVKVRNGCRSEDVIMGEKIIRDHFKHFAQDDHFRDFVVLNTSSQTAEETAQEVEKLVSRA